MDASLRGMVTGIQSDIEGGKPVEDKVEVAWNAIKEKFEAAIEKADTSNMKSWGRARAIYGFGRRAEPEHAASDAYRKVHSAVNGTVFLMDNYTENPTIRTDRGEVVVTAELTMYRTTDKSYSRFPISYIDMTPDEIAHIISTRAEEAEAEAERNVREYELLGDSAFFEPVRTLYGDV